MHIDGIRTADNCIMEAIPTEYSEVDEKKGEQVSQHCLRLPPIVRQILENFSSHELLKLSLVNKLWNYEARSLMRDQGNIKVYSSTWGRHGDYENEPCLNFIPIASDLEKMNIVPFTGLHFSIYHSDTAVCRSYSIESLHLTYKIILDRLPCKHLTVKFLGNGRKNCATVMLAQRILEERCGVLEELHLGYSSKEFLQPIFQDRSMPRLKSLTVESSELNDNLPLSSCLKVLVSRAPNLKELHVDRFLDLTVNVLEGSSAVLPIKFTVRPLQIRICESLIKHMRAKTMEIFIGEAGRISEPEELNSLIPQLLEASRRTITSLWIDLLFAVPLMCYGICLENVTELKITFGNGALLEELEPSMLELPKGLDFTRVFPKLNEVTIDYDYSLGFPIDVVSAFVEQAKAVTSRALPDRASNIKVLKINRINYVVRPTLHLLAQMFPDVKTVHTKASQRLPFTLLREYFLCLEEVEDWTPDLSEMFKCLD